MRWREEKLRIIKKLYKFLTPSESNLDSSSEHTWSSTCSSCDGSNLWHIFTRTRSHIVHIITSNMSEGIQKWIEINTTNYTYYASHGQKAKLRHYFFSLKRLSTCIFFKKVFTDDEWIYIRFYNCIFAFKDSIISKFLQDFV